MAQKGRGEGEEAGCRIQFKPALTHHIFLSFFSSFPLPRRFDTARRLGPTTIKCRSTNCFLLGKCDVIGIL